MTDPPGPLLGRPPLPRSGRFRPLSTLLGLGLFGLPAAAVGGYAAYRLARHDLDYLPLLFLCGVPAGRAAQVTVRVGHARNRSVGLLVGLLLGAASLAVAVQSEFAHAHGLQHWWRLDALPPYTKLKLLTGWGPPAGNAGAIDADDADAGPPPDPVDTTRTLADLLGRFADPSPAAYFGLLVELAALGWLPVLLGRQAAGGPYAEGHGCWFQPQDWSLGTDGRGALLAWARTGDPGELGRVRPNTSAAPVAGATNTLTVYHLPGVPDGPVLLDLQPGDVLRRVPLTPAEVDALHAVLPLPGRAPVPVEPPPAAPLRPTVGGAEVVDLPPDAGATVLTRGSGLRLVVLGGWPLWLGLLVAAAGGLTAWRWHDHLGDAGTLAAVLFAGAVLRGSYLVTVAGEARIHARGARQRLAAAVAARPDPLVHPDDPDAELVGVIPRAHWPRLMLVKATDLGFLRLDPVRREVRLEGGKQRWRLPAGAIAAVTVEEYAEGPVDANQFQVFSVVVLTATVDGRPWEVPLGRAQLEWGRWAGPRRRAEADELAGRIRALAGLPAG